MEVIDLRFGKPRVINARERGLQTHWAKEVLIRLIISNIQQKRLNDLL